MRGALKAPALGEPPAKAHGRTPSRPAQRAAAVRARMLDGAVLPTMLRLALPTVLVLVAQTSVGIAETFYVSFLGTAALAGVALVFPLFMLMMMMSNGGLGGGVASAVARALGAGRHEDADDLVLHALVLGAAFGLIFSAGALLFGPAMYRALGGTGAALDAAVLYSAFVFAGAVPIWIVNLLAAALRGSGNVRVPALITLVGAVILVAASPALIFGFGFVPRLGIAGAGTALGTYYALAAVVLVRYLRSARTDVRLRLRPLQLRLFRDILRVGLLSALNTVQPNLTVLLVTGAVAHFGVDALAGYGMASRLDYVLVPLLFGLGTAVLTMVGTNIGAGNLARARRIAWTGVAAGALVAEAIGLCAVLFPLAWLHLFSRDPAVLAPGVLYLRVVAPVYGLFGSIFVFNFVGQGSGRVLWPFVAGSVRLVIAAVAGWYAVTALGATLPVLFAIVASSFAASAAVVIAAARSGALWRPRTA